jgi:uncharacterized membrane protein YagU involved in acid resistance
MSTVTEPVDASGGVGWRVFSAALVGGTMAGAFDITYAFTNWGLQGIAPMRILHSVASGLVGREVARAGGMDTAILGAALHFSMTFVMGLVFVVASLMLPVLRRAPVIWGMSYGGAIYIVMNYIVVPLSLAGGRSAPPISDYVSGFLVHVFLVGLPIALVTRMYLPPEKA